MGEYFKTGATDVLRIKLRKSDRMFTKLVRGIYEYTCQKCGKMYIHGVHNMANLGVSHYWSRSRESVRFDLENVTLLCNLPCHHRWGGEEREDYKAYMIKRLGPREFDLLMLRAHTYQKRDDKRDEFVIEQQLKEAGND